MVLDSDVTRIGDHSTSRSNTRLRVLIEFKGEKSAFGIVGIVLCWF